MLLAAQPPSHPSFFESRRQHPFPLSHAPSTPAHSRDASDLSAPPDLTFSPAPSDFSSSSSAAIAAPDDGGLASHLHDALNWGDLSADEPASPFMHGYHLGGAPYRAPPRSNSQQPTTAADAAAGSNGLSNGSNNGGGSSSSSLHPWPTYANSAPHGGRSAARFAGQLAGHKRSHSGSTVASTGPASPFTPLSAYPQIHDPESQYAASLLDHFDFNTPQQPQQSLYTKSIPAAQTFSDTFYQNYAPAAYHADPNLAYQAAMRRAMMQPDNDPPALSRLPTGEFDSSFKATLDARGQNVPKLGRSLSNIYQDELYDGLSQPATAPLPNTRRAPMAGTHSGSQSASPRNVSSNEMFTQLLQAANNGHLSAGNSPSDVSRERSPFRPNSDLAPRLQSAAQLRERQKAASDLYAYAQHAARHSPQEEPTTISPKDAFPEHNDVDATDYSAAMMFPPMSAVSAPALTTPPVLGSSQMDNRRPLSTQVASLQRQSSSHSTQASQMSTSTPEFRPLVSMESTYSEGGAEDAYAHAPLSAGPSSHPSSSQQSSSSTRSHPLPQRPSHTTANSGTYSCSYPHCSSRFETAAKLQKHKRDVHRPVSPTGADDEDDEEQVHSPRTTAALLAARNSQAGPHKCQRTNPQTGRPCNSIFSRPYDLTRHEDTIHNSRKHKVRCPFCVEEKTFSRADALTRHLRVVHPEKETPGRRRRG